MQLLRLKFLAFVSLALLSSACAANPPAQAEAEEPALVYANESPVEAAEPTQNWSERAREVLVNALSLTGIRYKYGGKTPETGFDCSGFVRYVYQQAANLSLPHSARAISQLGKSIPKAELQPGDLVFFNTLKSAFSHVGIYLGDNRFIHSPSSGGSVRVDSLQSEYWQKRYNGAQRIEQKEDSQ